MSYLSNLFGSIAGTQGSGLYRAQTDIGFIPYNSSGGTIDIKGIDAQWLGLKNKQMQKWAYEYCFPLASVVDRLAEADTTGEVEILRASGKGKEDYATSPWATRMNTLLAQPNPLQSWSQFRGQQVVYKKIFGFCPVLPVMPMGISDKSYAIAMINLPPWCFDVVSTKSILGQSTLDGLVKEYKVTLLNKTSTFTPDQIFIIEDSFMQDEEYDYLLPKSRLVGLDMAVSNICAAMEADNVLLRKRGPLGFISHDAAATKDAVAGYLPMTQNEKNELQTSLSQYGLNLHQFQYAISRQAVRWNPMSYNVTELGTKDTVIAGEKAICHRYGYSYILYEDSGATFSNQNGAHKALWQNNIIPGAEKDMQKYNKFFDAKSNNAVITLDYSYLPVLQENEMERANARKAMNEALKVEYDNNLITRNQWLTALGYDTVTDGDKYLKDESSTNNSEDTSSGMEGDEQDRTISEDIEEQN